MELAEAWLAGTPQDLRWSQFCGRTEYADGTVSVVRCPRNLRLGEHVAVFWYDVEDSSEQPTAEAVGVFRETPDGVEEAIGLTTEYASFYDFRLAVEDSAQRLGLSTVADCQDVQRLPDWLPASLR